MAAPNQLLGQEEDFREVGFQVKGCNLGKGQGTSGAEGFETDFLTMRAAEEIGEVHVGFSTRTLFFCECQFGKQE